MSRVLVALTGSISAYKVVDLISELVQMGVEVECAATPSALRFVGTATLEGITGRAVFTDAFQPGRAMDHIKLIREADLVLVAPATAETLIRLATHVGESPIGTLFLAHDWKRPFLIAPAMNASMWAHPVTVEAVSRLTEWGVELIGPDRGRLACGEEGEGRLAATSAILNAILRHGLLGDRRRVLVTGGGTEEPIDAVRTIHNRSTGETACRIVEYLGRSFAVTALLAESARAPLRAERVERFSSSEELAARLKRELSARSIDWIIHAAAVSDYRLFQIEDARGRLVPGGMGKVSSTERELTLRLRPTEKLLPNLRCWSRNPSIRVTAFKLTVDEWNQEGRRKAEALLESGDADEVVWNDWIERRARYRLIPDGEFESIEAVMAALANGKADPSNAPATIRDEEHPVCC